MNPKQIHSSRIPENLEKISGSSSWTVLAVSLDKFGSFSGFWHGECDDLEAVPGQLIQNSFGSSDHFMKSIVNSFCLNLFF